MRILLVGNYLPGKQQSMLRFAEMLEAMLLQQGHEVRVWHPPVRAGRLAQGGEIAKWLAYLDKFVFCEKSLREAAEWAEVVHICDHANAMYTRFLASRPHVVTCHDMLAISSALGEIPQHRTRWSGRKLQGMIVNGLLRTQHVVCVSEATKQELLRITGRDENSVTVIYNDMNRPFSPAAPQEADETVTRLGVRGPYLFHVGGNQWYKNRLGVLKIFDSLLKRSPASDLKLVMAGRPWSSEMLEFVNERQLGSRVVPLGTVTDEELRMLYSRAAALLFPSLAEGFGWPILEAQACWCPVFTLNRAPMTEVGGAAAVYLDPENEPEAAKIIAENLPRVEQIRQAGLENAKRFRGAIHAYLDIYRTVINARSAEQTTRDFNPVKV